MSREELQAIVKDFLPKLKGLNESEISSVMNLIRYSVRNSPISVEFVDSEYDGSDKAKSKIIE
jgi:hypothetical protein